MATRIIPNPSHDFNTPSTYRLAGSCSARAYVACDDTPYWEERPITTGGGVNPNYDHTFMGKVNALRATKEGCYRDFRVLRALIDANPDATAAELIGMLN